MSNLSVNPNINFTGSSSNRGGLSSTQNPPANESGIPIHQPTTTTISRYLFVISRYLCSPSSVNLDLPTSVFSPEGVAINPNITRVYLAREIKLGRMTLDNFFARLQRGDYDKVPELAIDLSGCDLSEINSGVLKNYLHTLVQKKNLVALNFLDQAKISEILSEVLKGMTPSHLSKLVEISVAGCKLSQDALKSLFGLSSLEFLDASRNELVCNGSFSCLGNCGRLKNLKYLNLSNVTCLVDHCYVKSDKIDGKVSDSLKECLSRISGLQTLKLDKLKIRRDSGAVATLAPTTGSANYDQACQSLKNLIELGAIGTAFCRNGKNHPNLKKISLTCDLTIKNIFGLSKMYVWQHQLSVENFLDKAKWEYLHGDGNSTIKELVNLTPQEWPVSLRKLAIPNGELTEQQLKNFFTRSFLTGLDISGNTGLSKAIINLDSAQLPKLTEFIASKCDLSEAAIKKLFCRNLTILDLSGNKLPSLSFNLPKCLQVFTARKCSLSINALQDIFNHKSIEVLDVRDNSDFMQAVRSFKQGQLSNLKRLIVDENLTEEDLLNIIHHTPVEMIQFGDVPILVGDIRKKYVQQKQQKEFRAQQRREEDAQRKQLEDQLAQQEAERKKQQAIIDAQEAKVRAEQKRQDDFDDLLTGYPGEVKRQFKAVFNGESDKIDLRDYANLALLPVDALKQLTPHLKHLWLPENQPGIVDSVHKTIQGNELRNLVSLDMRVQLSTKKTDDLMRWALKTPSMETLAITFYMDQLKSVKPYLKNQNDFDRRKQGLEKELKDKGNAVHQDDYLALAELLHWGALRGYHTPASSSTNLLLRPWGANELYLKYCVLEKSKGESYIKGKLQDWENESRDSYKKDRASVSAQVFAAYKRGDENLELGSYGDKLDALPEEILALSQLKTLRLKQSFEKAVPLLQKAAYRNFYPQLKILDASGGRNHEQEADIPTKLTSPVPNDIFEIPSLEKINLSQITFLKSILSKIPLGSKDKDVLHSLLVALEAAAKTGNLPNLTELDFTGTIDKDAKVLFDKNSPIITVLKECPLVSLNVGGRNATNILNKLYQKHGITPKSTFIPQKVMNQFEIQADDNAAYDIKSIHSKTSTFIDDNEIKELLAFGGARGAYKENNQEQIIKQLKYILGHQFYDFAFSLATSVKEMPEREVATGCELFLEKINSVDDFPKDFGENRIFVGKLGNTYHFRIFDQNGKMTDKKLSDIKPESNFVKQLDKTFKDKDKKPITATEMSVLADIVARNLNYTRPITNKIIYANVDGSFRFRIFDEKGEFVTPTEADLSLSEEIKRTLAKGVSEGEQKRLITKEIVTKLGYDKKNIKKLARGYYETAKGCYRTIYLGAQVLRRDIRQGGDPTIGGSTIQTLLAKAIGAVIAAATEEVPGGDILSGLPEMMLEWYVTRKFNKENEKLLKLLDIWGNSLEDFADSAARGMSIIKQRFVDVHSKTLSPKDLLDDLKGIYKWLQGEGDKPKWRHIKADLETILAKPKALWDGTAKLSDSQQELVAKAWAIKDTYDAVMAFADGKIKIDPRYEHTIDRDFYKVEPLLRYFADKHGFTKEDLPDDVLKKLFVWGHYDTSMPRKDFEESLEKAKRIYDAKEEQAHNAMISSIKSEIGPVRQMLMDHKEHTKNEFDKDRIVMAGLQKGMKTLDKDIKTLNNEVDSKVASISGRIANIAQLIANNNTATSSTPLRNSTTSSPKMEDIQEIERKLEAKIEKAVGDLTAQVNKLESKLKEVQTENENLKVDLSNTKADLSKAMVDHQRVKSWFEQYTNVRSLWQGRRNTEPSENDLKWNIARDIDYVFGAFADWYNKSDFKTDYYDICSKALVKNMTLILLEAYRIDGFDTEKANRLKEAVTARLSQKAKLYTPETRFLE